MSCDDLLEIADKAIDSIKTQDPKAIKADAEGGKARLHTEQAMKKP